MLFLAAAPGRHVFQQRLFAEIEFHDRRHEAVHRLVVGDAGADGVGERHVAGGIGRHQARHAEDRVGAEGEGVDEIVVNAAIDDVDALRPLRRAHIDDLVLDEEIAAFDQFDAELVGEERMFVIGGVEHARRQQHDGRFLRRRQRRDRLERGEQLVRIIFDRRNAVAREQFRKQPHHDFAVLQHIGNAGGRARIVLEHVEGVGVDADDVDAGDVDIDVVRHALAVHLRAERRIAEHQIFRNDSGAQDFARAIDILDEQIERVDALGQALLQELPFGSRHDARDDVERDQALGGVGLAVNGEGDADAAEDEFGFAAAVIENVGRDLLEPLRQLAIGRPHFVTLVTLHLVEGRSHTLKPPAALSNAPAPTLCLNWPTG